MSGLRLNIYYTKEDQPLIEGVERLARVQSGVRNEPITRSIKIMEYVKKGYEEETRK